MLRNNKRESMPVKLGPPPTASSYNTSKSMRGNKSKDTKPELMLRKALRNNGLLGYRLNWKNAPGRPDICFTKKEVAIFVNGCFWHRCPYCRLDLPNKNRRFWKNKFIRNKERDTKKNQRLRNAGWKTITVWECQIKKDIDKVLRRIIKTLLV